MDLFAHVDYFNAMGRGKQSVGQLDFEKVWGLAGNSQEQIALSGVGVDVQEYLQAEAVALHFSLVRRVETPVHSGFLFENIRCVAIGG